MTSKLDRRLERLEAELTPKEEDVLTLVVTRIGGPGEPKRTEIHEIRCPKLAGPTTLVEENRDESHP